MSFLLQVKSIKVINLITLANIECYKTCFIYICHNILATQEFLPKLSLVKLSKITVITHPASQIYSTPYSPPILV